MAGLQLCPQTTQEGFRPRRRIINTSTSGAELNDEDLQRKLKEDMQQRLADEDMGFTPHASNSWLKTRHIWIRHRLQQRSALFMAGSDSGPIASELQPYSLTRVMPLSRQPEDPLYQ